MCCEGENVARSWHTTVADLAAESARRCFAWLPYSRPGNRIHPTVIEVPNRNFTTIDARKQLHVIHMYPDTTHPSVLVGYSRRRCQDATDRSSPESLSVEEYWFTKSNRPLRLQKNPCRCSFRRSIKLPLKSKEETKNSVDNAEPVVQRKAKSNALKDTSNVYHLSVPLKSCIVERIADSLADEILNQVIAECISSTHIASNQSCIDVISTSVEHLASDTKHWLCNNTECTKDFEFNLNDFGKFEDFNLNSDGMKGHQASGGYMNPTFVGSNGTIDKLPADTLVVDTHYDSDAKLDASSCNHITRHNPVIKGVNQDYNANEKDIISQKNKLNDSDKKEDFVEKRHHRDCSHSSKPCEKKPVLLFIHGAGNSAQVWKNLMASMVASGYECIAPDLLGHGLSSTPHRASCYTFHSLLEDLLKVFDKYVAKGRSAVILGHGYGCSFATAISRFRAEHVVQLVLISGGGPSPLAPPDSNRTSPFMLACLEPLLLCGFKRYFHHTAYAILHAKPKHSGHCKTSCSFQL